MDQDTKIAGGRLPTTTHAASGKLIMAVASGSGIIGFILTLLYVGITSRIAGLLASTWFIPNSLIS